MYGNGDKDKLEWQKNNDDDVHDSDSTTESVINCYGVEVKERVTSAIYLVDG